MAGKALRGPHMDPSMRDNPLSTNERNRCWPAPHSLTIALAIILIIMSLTLVRYSPLGGFTAAPSSYSGGYAYRYYQVLTGGHDTNESVPVYSSFDSGVNPVRGEILFVKLQVVMSLTIGYNRYGGDLVDASFVESITLTAAFLAMGWMWAGKVRQGLAKREQDWLR